MSQIRSWFWFSSIYTIANLILLVFGYTYRNNYLLVVDSIIAASAVVTGIWMVARGNNGRLR